MSLFWNAIIAFTSALIGAVLVIIYNDRVSKRQEKALIQVFTQEFLLLFKRCAMYYGQMLKGAISHSTLFEITDSATVTKLAEVTKNPSIVQTVIQLKASFFQSIRWANMAITTVQETTKHKPMLPTVEGPAETDVTLTKSIPDTDSQSKTIVFFMGELTNPDGSFGRVGYKGKMEGITKLLDYLKTLNSQRSLGWLIEKLGFESGKKKEIEDFIEEARQQLKETEQVLEERRTEEKEMWVSKGEEFKEYGKE